MTMPHTKHKSQTIVTIEVDLGEALFAPVGDAAVREGGGAGTHQWKPGR